MLLNLLNARCHPGVMVGAHCQPDRIWDHLGDKPPATPVRNHLVFAHACERSGNKYLVKRWLFKMRGTVSSGGHTIL